jgi:hypothetical protein
MQLLFCKDAFGAFERLIQLVTWSRIVHVELAVAHGPGWAVVWSSSNRDGGVRLKRITVRPEAWEAVDIGYRPDAAALGLADPHKWTPADLHRWALAAHQQPTEKEATHA